jgi:ribose transport system substrate-binding protein
MVAVLLATVAACGRNSDAKAVSGPKGPKEETTTTIKTTGDPIKDAELIVEKGYTGTITQPPATGPKAVKGKKLFVISCYQLLDSCRIPSEAAQEAGKAMGWDTTIVDGGLDAGKESDGVKQAISSHADAIITAGVDCAPIQASLQQAKQAGIKLVGLYAFDCDDESLANPGAPLFDYIQRVGALGPADGAISYGEIKAAYAIAKLKGKVVAVDTTSPNHTVLRYTAQGFKQQVAKCKTCRVATTVSFTDEDVLSGKLKDTLVTTLQSYPTTNVIQVAVDPVFQIAVLPALANKPDIMTLGGEGVPANMDLIRSGKETMAMAVPHEWAGYLGVDAVNRLLAGVKPAQIPNQGFGYQIIDKDHNVPPSGPYLPLNMKTKEPVDFKAAYRKVWGVG